MNAAELEAQRWFKQARADLEVVHTLKSAGHYAATCFHSQQAAEKALKAVLYSQGSRVVLGHSVRELARQCEVYDSGFAALAGEAGLLDQYYIPTRYPKACHLRLCPMKHIPKRRQRRPRRLPRVF
jgi:HEPN domain-containing protein